MNNKLKDFEEDYLSGFNALTIDKQSAEYKLNSLFLDGEEVLTEDLIKKI